MADDGHIRTMLNGIKDTVLRQVFVKVFEYLLKDIRFGRAVDEDPSKNFGGGFFTGTTAGVANTEFSIEHTFGRKPYLAFQVLPLNTVNAQMVRLKNTRAADASRIYLSSPDTSAVFYLYVEG